jgi:glycosyltransferase involved in cell wall biosynthesis
MRILHVTPFYEPASGYGGMARCSAALCRALAARGHDVTVATALLDPRQPEREALGGVEVRRFPGPAIFARYLVPWGRGLDRFLAARAGSFDVGHLHGHRNGLAVVARQALAAARLPWVLLPSGTYPHHGQRRLAKTIFDGLLGERVVREASALVAVSAAEARDLPRPATVIPNGVEAIEPSPRAASAGAGGRLIFVGSDRPQKRACRLPRVLEALPNAHLTLVGRFEPGLRKRFARFAERASFAGVLAAPEMAVAYGAADLLVHPAVGEAFGLVPFEAALSGTASVVAGGHGCGEWLSRAGGCVVPPDDEAALIAAVRARLADPSLAAAEAAAVADFTRRQLTWERTAQAIEALYASLILERRKSVA